MTSTALAAAALAAALPAVAQYSGQAKQDQQNQAMRAVAVLEWTGDPEHPKASRLVPVALYDGQDLQDAGIYMARPAPLALSSEVEYELKDNGKTTGLFVVNTAGQEQGSWVGFGAWKPLPKPRASAPPERIDDKDAWGNDNDGKPVLHRKHHDGDQSSGKSGDTSSTAPAVDPDRPTLHKKASKDDSAGSGSPAPDPDRPTLKKKADKPVPAAKNQEDTANVESVQTLSDPDRPKLVRGKPANQGGTVLPTLMGLPPDMNQTVAVSDAKSRPEHVWSYIWATPEDEGNMRVAMEDMAREALGLAAPPAAAPAVPKAKPASTVRKKTAVPLPPLPAPAPLKDEQFRVFELAYGSGATMVLSARTDGEGAQQKFITLICQPNIYGKATVLFKSVTDAAHLDETPRMRLVDAVDVMADNRGELLFELRGATQRQFALYRVWRGQVSRLFATAPGSTMPEAAATAADSHS